MKTVDDVDCLSMRVLRLLFRNNGEMKFMDIVIAAMLPSLLLNQIINNLREENLVKVTGSSKKYVSLTPAGKKIIDDLTTRW